MTSEVGTDPARQRTARSTLPGRVLPATVLSGLVVLVAGLVLVAPGQYGVLMALGAVALAAVVVGLADPAIATAYLVVSAFLRLALPTGPLPTDAFILAFGGLLLAVALRVATRSGVVLPVGRLGMLVGLFLGWNVWSIIAGHDLPAAYPAIGVEIDVVRFVLIGTVMPFVVLLIARSVLTGPRAVRVLVGTVLAVTAYSALVSVLQFHGPASLVWPSYARANPEWPGRAIGVVNQPVVHGLLLTVGYLTALMVASDVRVARWRRAAAGVLAAVSCYAVYLTFTRSAWLCLAVAVLGGALLARGWRRGFVVTAAVGVLGVAVNWATFTSDDRSAGGVGSTNEIQDRLNINATGVWATLREPLSGWGVGRYPAVNTYHHQQLGPDIPWDRGFGLAAHNDLLGISAELGLVGAGLWMAILGVVVVGLVRALRELPSGGHEQRFVVVALLVLLAWGITGLTVDQRLFDVTNLVTTALVGSALGVAARRRSGVGAATVGES